MVSSANVKDNTTNSCKKHFREASTLKNMKIASASFRDCSPVQIFDSYVQILHSEDENIKNRNSCAKFLGSFEQQCKALHGRMKFWYSVHQTQSRLDQLKRSMIQAPGKPWPKLRGKAGETRALVPFCEQLCSEILNPEDPQERGLQICATAFQACYQQLSHTTYEPQALARKARTFALAYVSLASLAASSNQQLWKITPKLHLFMEMTQYADRNPSDVWTYREESCGGDISSLAERRGGSSNPHAVGMAFFQKFAANHLVTAP